MAYVPFPLGTTNIYNNYVRAGLPPGSTNGAVPKSHRADGIAGALGLGQEKSFAIRTFNTFWVYTTPFIGAIVADCWWGRYNAILFFSLVCLCVYSLFICPNLTRLDLPHRAGHVILTGSASPSALQHPHGSLAGLVVAIFVMGIGAGSIKANVSPLMAEQYAGKLRKQVLKSGETVIISPALTYQRIYMYFYAAINFGAAAAISASFLARDQGYWVAFLVPTIIFAIIPIVLVFGKKLYVNTPPRGSVLLEVRFPFYFRFFS